MSDRDGREGVSVRFFNPIYETMDPAEVRSLSFELFRREINRAYDLNPFYRRKFDEAGMDPGKILTRDDVSRVPVSTKEEFILDVNRHPPFGSRFHGSPEQVSLIIATSGTSGRGQEIHALSANDADRVYLAEAFGYFWAGARAGTVVMQTMPVTTTGAGIFWHGALHLKTKSCVVHIGNHDARQKLNLMHRYGARVLITTGPYLRRLEFVADELGMDLRRDLALRSIITLGEGASVAWIEKRQEIWGAKLYEHYGCTQRAFMGTCEYGMLRDGHRGMIHALPHLCFVEVVDPDTGRQVRPGEEGELVVTPFGSEITPIIRFATRDRARYLEASSCRCGRPFDGLESCSVGRADDMIKVKGVNVWQNVVDAVVLAREEVLEYKGEVTVEDGGRETVSVFLEFRPNVTPTDRATLRDGIMQDLRARTGLGFVVAEWSGPSIFEPYGESTQRKVRRWVDRRWSP